jgi:hypothetical protein
MSIFSVLKYPITIKFEEQHLALLPRELLVHWWKDVERYHNISISKGIGKPTALSTGQIPPEPARISSYINNHLSKRHRARHLEVLQRAIFRLDE